MGTKICSKCGKELEKNKYFNKRKASKDGFTKRCKECIAKSKKQYYTNNKEKVSIKVHEYRIQNKEKVSTSNKKYVQNNKQLVIEYKKQYYQNNKKILAENNKQNYQNNKESYLERQKQYRLKNLDVFRINAQKRKARAKQLISTLTIEQWENIKRCFDKKCAYCGEEKPLEQEHFLALSKGGEYTTNNIIPACKSCNCSKHDSDFFRWYSGYKYYSKQREQKILKHLGYDNEQQQLKIN